MARSRARKRHVQLGLDDARKEVGRGGWRRDAGRKRKPGAVSHDTRAELRSYHPQHVTLRLVDDAPKLARGDLMKLIRKAIAESHKDNFHIVEFNVLDNHLHLIVETANSLALARGMQGFAVRLAKRLNSALKRKGKWFASRYHARSLRTPREVFNALRYVLLNRKHHAVEKKFNKYCRSVLERALVHRLAAPISRHAWMVHDLITEPAPTKTTISVAPNDRLETTRPATIRRRACRETTRVPMTGRCSRRPHRDRFP